MRNLNSVVCVLWGLFFIVCMFLYTDGYIYSPFYSLNFFWFVVSVAIGFLLLWVAQLFPVAGAITSEEQQRRENGKRGIFFVAVCPILLYFGLLGHFYTPGWKTTLVLYSQLCTATNWNWPESLKQKNEQYQAGSRIIDVAPTVDIVLRELHKFYNPNWKNDQSEVQNLIRETVLRVLDNSEELRKISKIEECYRDSRPNSMPSWLVETVEIAVLKAISQHYNTRNIIYILPERTTQSKYRKEWAKEYLSNSDIGLNTLVEIFTIQQQQAIRLKQLIKFAVQQGRFVARCVFEIPESDAPIKIEISTDREQIGVALQTIDPRKGSLQIIEFEFSGDPEVWPNFLLHQQQRIPILRHNGQSIDNICIDFTGAYGHFLRETVKNFQKSSSYHAQEFRKFTGDMHLSLDVFKNLKAQRRICVDARQHAVLVYDKNFPKDILQDITQHTHRNSFPKWQGVSVKTARSRIFEFIPGSYSWSQLAIKTKYFGQLPSNQEALVNVFPIYAKWSEAEIPRDQYPVIQRLSITKDERCYNLTYIAIDYVEEGMIFGKKNFDEIKSSAGIFAILEAIHSAAYEKIRESSTIRGNEEAILVLKTSDIHKSRTISMMYSLRLFMLGVAVYMFFIVIKCSYKT